MEMIVIVDGYVTRAWSNPKTPVRPGEPLADDPPVAEPKTSDQIEGSGVERSVIDEYAPVSNTDLPGAFVGPHTKVRSRR